MRHFQSPPPPDYIGCEPLPEGRVAEINAAREHLKPLLHYWSGTWRTHLEKELAAGVSIEDILTITAADVSMARDIAAKRPGAKYWLDDLLRFAGERRAAQKPTPSPVQPEQREEQKRRASVFKRVADAIPGAKLALLARAANRILAGEDFDAVIADYAPELPEKETPYEEAR